MCATAAADVRVPTSSLPRIVRYVHAGRLGRDEQRGGDLPVALPGRHQPQHLKLPLGKPGTSIATRGTRGTRPEPHPPSSREPGDLVAERDGPKPLRQPRGLPQPGDRPIPVPALQRRRRTAQQRLCERVRRAERLPRRRSRVPPISRFNCPGGLKQRGERQPLRLLHPPERFQLRRDRPQPVPDLICRRTQRAIVSRGKTNPGTGRQHRPGIPGTDEAQVLSIQYGDAGGQSGGRPRSQPEL